MQLKELRAPSCMLSEFNPPCSQARSCVLFLRTLGFFEVMCAQRVRGCRPNASHFPKCSSSRDAGSLGNLCIRREGVKP